MKNRIRNHSLRKFSLKSNNSKKKKIVLISVSLSLTLILLLTLYPLNFTYPEEFSRAAIRHYFNNRSNFYDFTLNIILFMPFGLSVTYLLSLRRSRFLPIIIVLLGSFSLSLTVELIQIFLPSRSSTLTDIFTNSLGGVLGSFCFYLPRFKKFISLKRLIICFILYSTITFLFSIPLFSRSHLEQWDPSFPLLLGNEKTGNRPWQGNISDIYIANQAISNHEVNQVFGSQDYSNDFSEKAIAFYPLSGRIKYQDRTKKSPSLFWQGKQLDCQDNCNVLLDSQHWLSTESSASSITERIRETSQFTLITKASTANINQTGPARIISLSGSPYKRNFSLGQEGSSLVFRIRTPISGDNGLRPELMIPDVFSDKHIHLIVVTYANSLLQVFVDKVENYYYLEFIPAKSALLNIFPSESDDNLLIYALVYYSVIFAPLGLILSLIIHFHKKKLDSVFIFVSMGVFVPVLLLEIILTSGTGRAISLNNILLGIAITTMAMLLVSGQLLVMRRVKDIVNSG